MDLTVTLSIKDTRHIHYTCAQCRYAECPVIFIVKLNAEYRHAKCHGAFYTN